MAVELLKEKYSGPINTVEIGSGARPVKVGGETCLPFLFEEGAMQNPPVTAIEVTDSDAPAKVKAAVSASGARLLCIRLASIHPDNGGRSSEEAVSAMGRIAKDAGLPLIITGCGDNERDNDALPKASQALKGQNCLFGIATQTNYKTLAATCLADGHSIIAESPIDINIAKQLNILITDMGFDPSRIVMHPTTTSLGYGMEYVYSIMERGRLAAFMGDKMLSMPFILFVGQETWRTKEAKESSEAEGVNWEVATAATMIQAGADILVLRHPESIRSVNRYIEMLTRR